MVGFGGGEVMPGSISRVLRLTAKQHQELREHLFPSDGCEAVAVALCGVLRVQQAQVLTLHRLRLIPHDACTERSRVRVAWPTDLIFDMIEEAARSGMAILKIHSHPGGFGEFSAIDDKSDRELFQSIHGWTDDDWPHASAVMLPGGRMFGRFISDTGAFSPISRVMIVGDDILAFDSGDSGSAVPEEQMRTAQAFGGLTTRLLSRLRIGIVGCSGTGSWVAEQLARLGVGHLVLVDADRIERKNLNRIIGSSFADAKASEFKVEALGKLIPGYGTGTSVTTLPVSCLKRDAVELLATCDILFGCMDAAEGREVLNRISTFYLIPYFDLGIQLRADGEGGVEVVCGSVHYLTPGGSSLLSRGVYTPERLRIESLRRTDPEAYEGEVEEGYIRNANEEAPAVVSVNGFCATMAVNELLARIHPYRDDPNASFQWQQFDLLNSFWQARDPGPACASLQRWVGRGETTPLLNSLLVQHA